MSYSRIVLTSPAAARPPASVGSHCWHNSPQNDMSIPNKRIRLSMVAALRERMGLGSADPSLQFPRLASKSSVESIFDPIVPPLTRSIFNNKYIH